LVFLRGGRRLLQRPFLHHVREESAGAMKAELIAPETTNLFCKREMNTVPLLNRLATFG